MQNHAGTLTHNCPQKTLKPKYLALAIAGAFGFMPALAGAQTEADADSAKMTEIITVTAQKRSQSLMEVPVAIDAIGADELKETGSIMLGEMADYTPGFSFSKQEVVQGTATMRGISSSNISTGGDPSVAVFFDDVYLPRAAQSVMFADMQRVEILKGPQGTLFGKNAAAGVVSMYPNQPAEDLDFSLSLRAGDYGLKRVEGMVNVPLSDSVFLRVNAMSNERDSFVDNLYEDYQGNELGNQDQQAVRLALRWQASEDTNLSVAYDWSDLDQGYSAKLGVSEYAYNMDPGSYKMQSDVEDGHESRDMSALTLKLEHDFSEQWSMKLVSSYRQWEVSGRDDTDGTANITRYVDTINYEDSDIFYNELQVNYQKDNLSFVSGITYSKEDVYQKTTINLTADTVTRLITEGLNDTLMSTLSYYGYDDATIAALGLPADHIWDSSDWANILSVLSTVDASVAELIAGLGTTAFSEELPLVISATGDLTYQIMAAGLGESALLGPSYTGQFWGEDVANSGDFTSIGAYADVDYQITPEWGVAVGLRYSRDEKAFSWTITENTLDGLSLPTMIDNLFPLMDNLEAEKDWNKLTGRVVTRYQPSKDQLLYLSYSTGYKAGGFDSLDPSTAYDPFEPEDVSNIEFGYKGELFDDALRLQVNLYDMNIDGRQLSVESQMPGSTALVPVIINGEQDILGAELIADWYVVDSLKLGLISEYRDIDSDWEPYYNYQGELITETLKSTSAITYTLTADWYPEVVLFDGSMKLHVDYVFEENIAEDDPDLLDVAYEIPGFFEDVKNLNARISWYSESDKWEVALWGKNLLDTTTFYDLGGFASEILGTPTLRVNEPRTVGAEVRYRF